MQISSTSDVDLEVLRSSAESLPEEWNATVDRQQTFMRAMDVPSWVSIAADAPWWKYFLAATAFAYVQGIVSEAGKDTWKNRGKVAAGVRSAGTAIARLAELVVAAQKAGNEKTFVMLSIPLANQDQSVRLKLEYATHDELEVDIAFFVHHVPAIEKLIVRRGLDKRPPTGGINLEIDHEDFSMLATWMDRETLQIEQEVLAL